MASKLEAAVRAAAHQGPIKWSKQSGTEAVHSLPFLAHEVQHARSFGKSRKIHKNLGRAHLGAYVAAQAGGLPTAINSYAPAFGKKGMKGSTSAALAGLIHLPRLLEEGAANVGASRYLKRKGLPSANADLTKAYGTYLAGAGVDVGAAYLSGAKKLSAKGRLKLLADMPNMNEKKRKAALEAIKSGYRGANFAESAGAGLLGVGNLGLNKALLSSLKTSQGRSLKSLGGKRLFVNADEAKKIVAKGTKGKATFTAGERDMFNPLNNEISASPAGRRKASVMKKERVPGETAVETRTNDRAKEFGEAIRGLRF